MPEVYEIYTTPRGRCRVWSCDAGYNAAAGIDLDNTFYARFETYAGALRWINA